MTRLFENFRKPQGWLGWLVARQMNHGHAKLTRWGLDHVRPDASDTILDIGCGGGGTIRRLAALVPEGKVHGLDYSETSVGISRRHNKALIRDGRVEVRFGSVSAMPYADGMFDLATAVETHYFWPDLVQDMKEILRVLKLGGDLVIVGEAYQGGKFDERNAGWAKLTDMTCYSAPELEAALAAAGFTRIKASVDPERGWIRVVGGRPT